MRISGSVPVGNGTLDIKKKNSNPVIQGTVYWDAHTVRGPGGFGLWYLTGSVSIGGNKQQFGAHGDVLYMPHMYTVQDLDLLKQQDRTIGTIAVSAIDTETKLDIELL